MVGNGMVQFSRFGSISDTLNCAVINSVLGSNYCPVCTKLSVFDPYGKPERPRAMCKNCKSAERHRVFFLLAQEVLMRTNSAKVLYFGTDRIVRKNLPRNFELTEVELPADTDTPIDFSALQGQKFDLVFCGDQFEFLDNDVTFVRQLSELISDSGILITFMTPGKEISGESSDSGSDVVRTSSRVRSYDQDSFEKLLEEGFDIEPVYIHESFTEEQIKLFSIRGRQIYYVCHRK